MTSIDTAFLQQWTGRSTQQKEGITPRMVESFVATLAPHLAPVAGDEVPLAFHWCLMPPIEPMNKLGRDGHPERGGFLPPVPLPRRMWAGGEIETFASLRVGDSVTLRSVIKDVSVKEGRSGVLCFVQVEHSYSTARGLAIRERQDIVYRNEAPAGSPVAAKPEVAAPASESSAPVDATSTLLFRYSALTFNGHRIHYDMPYATQVEGYDGLVIHGPLQASILFNQAARLQGSVPRLFSYRGLMPATVGHSLQACATREADATIKCWTQSPFGKSMEGMARW